MKKLPPSSNTEYTKKQLEYLQVYNSTSYNKLAYDEEHAFRSKMNDLTYEQASIAKKVTESHLMIARESLRPHRMYHAEVCWIPQEQKYVCCMLNIDDEGDGVGISAYGDTPAEACDNFDHQWVHGREDV